VIFTKNATLKNPQNTNPHDTDKHPALAQNTHAPLAPEIEILKILSDHIQSHTLFKNHVYLVGGMVRDFLLNLPIKDIDLVVDVSGGAQKFCEDFHQKFPQISSTPHELGRGYPIWHILIKKIGVDVAETQKECFPDPQSRQRITTFGSFSEDIFRRDFTINMLAYDFTLDQIIDPSGCGREDLQNKIIRTHPQLDPDKVFSDDPLRMLRAVRFAVKFDFQISEKTQASILKNADRLQIVSSERILSELEKIIFCGGFVKALQLFYDLGLFSFIFKNLDFNKIDVLINNEKMQKAPNTVQTQLAFLGVNQNPKDFTSFLDFLKLDHKTRQNIIKTVEGYCGAYSLISPAVSANDEILLQQRTWARKYNEVLENIFFLIPEQKDHFSQALHTPLRTKPLIKVDDLQKEFSVSGAQIGKLLDIALLLEDRWILKNQKEISVDLSWALLKEHLKQQSKITGHSNNN